MTKKISSTKNTFSKNQKVKLYQKNQKVKKF